MHLTMPPTHLFPPLAGDLLLRHDAFNLYCEPTVTAPCHHHVHPVINNTTEHVVLHPDQPTTKKGERRRSKVKGSLLHSPLLYRHCQDRHSLCFTVEVEEPHCTSSWTSFSCAGVKSWKSICEPDSPSGLQYQKFVNRMANGWPHPVCNLANQMSVIRFIKLHTRYDHPLVIRFTNFFDIVNWMRCHPLYILFGNINRTPHLTYIFLK